MNSLRVNRKFDLALFMIAISAAIVFLAGSDRATAQTAKSETSNITWESNDDGWRRRVQIHGNVEFADDYLDVAALSDGAFLRVEEDQNGETRRLEVRRDASGMLVRRYLVNGELRPLDDKGKRWVAGLLLMAVRQGAIDVDKRVQRIVRERGVNGMLEEIASITGDYAKRLYFQALLTNKGLRSDDLQKVVRLVGTQMSSDYEKATTLKNTAETFLDDPSLSNAFFQAIATINSDYERRTSLSALLKRKTLSDHVLTQMLDVASTISSDYEKATFLVEASNMYTGDARLRSTFLKAVEMIKSDYERGRVLNALLKNKQIG
jgi:hypothetical protein